MNKKDMLRVFRENIKLCIDEAYGRADTIALLEAWNDYTDMTEVIMLNGSVVDELGHEHTSYVLSKCNEFGYRW